MAKINNKPAVSVIVPVFNTEEYLEKCIGSILGQSFTNFELILINDGSTDSSLDICKKYAEIDKRIDIIDKNNGGAAQARNVAIEQSQGEYIAFIDSDDYIHADFIKTLLENAKNKNADISACNYFCVYNEKQIIERTNKPAVKNFNNIEAVRDLLLENSTLETILCNKLFKRSLFIDNNLRLIEGEIYEDTRLLYKLAYFSKSITFTSQPLYYYLQRDGSVMNHGVKLPNLLLQTKITEEAGEWLKQRTDKLNLEVEAYKLTGQINSLNYMIDGKKIYNDIWKKVSASIKSNRKKYLDNPYISKGRKLLIVFSSFGKTPYKIVRNQYIKSKQKGLVK